jgi:hypothetical protein
MEYWEFLLQKEGDRSWLPLKSSRMEIAAGRYRIVAHSTRTNADVEICVTHQSLDEVPPKRRSQKRSRRTNPEGLMVVIPFTYLKPGLWELRCCGDIMSDFLGNSWQHAVQLQVLPKPVEVLPTDEPVSPVGDGVPTRIPTALSENSAVSPDPELVVELSPTETEFAAVTPLLAESAVLSNRDWQLEHEDYVASDGNNGKETEQEIEPPSSHALVPLEPAELDENKSTLTTASAELARLTNPILDESLQMLEQILQQVLEPVLQEFDLPESPDEQISITSEPELLLDTDTNQQGLILTLDEEGLVAKRGESLTITGQVDVLDVHQFNGSETRKALSSVFQGSLRYELRDPQTSQVLLDVRQPLSAQAIPLTFSHTLEIPPDCKTRLILGKVMLYGSNPTPLASQPFSVTADLDELLGAIIPGSQAMPVAKMLVLANNPPDSQDEQEDSPESTSLPLNQALLDLVDTHRSYQPIAFQPVSKQVLPPQLYQPGSNQKSSKSLDLPNFPQVRSVTTSAESSAALNTPETVEAKPENPEGLPAVRTDDLSPETLNSQAEVTPEEVAAEPESQEAVPALEKTTLEEGITPDTSELPESPVPIEDSGLTSVSSDRTVAALWDATETPTTITTAADSEINDSEVTELWETPEPEKERVEAQILEPVVDSEMSASPQPSESVAVDSAFQSLNVQDRFWLRLNSLAADAELSEWLKSEPLSAANLPEDAEQLLESDPDPTFVEAEEVEPSLEPDTVFADFDESLWEESEEFGSASVHTDEIQSSSLEVSSFLEGKIPNQQPLVGTIDWTAHEIVVEDEELPAPEQPQPRVGDASQVVHSAEPLSSQPEPKMPSPLKSEPPLPTPGIFIPTNELAPGEPVTVRVKLPADSAHLCVKLWIQDRQSRSLLDGPRWLVDLLPDGSGELEAMTQLIVPFGSVEIRFEAIAVDIHTQRESNKITVDCMVVPRDLPNISLDEFES